MTTVEAPERPVDQREFSPAGFVIGLVLGAPISGYGIWWLLDNERLTNPDGWATTLVAAVLIHDLIVFPLAAVAAIVVTRWLPGWVRAPVQVGAVLTAVCALYATPAVTDYGRRASNPTLLPHDMAANLTIVIVAIWLAMAVWAFVRRRRDVAGRAST